MRRKDREVKEIDDLLAIINQCKVCHLGFIDEEGVYIVPMNFGYTYDDHLTLYFHSAKVGRKITCIKNHPEISFEMDTSHLLVTGEEACDYTYSYESIIGKGKAYILEDHKEEALNHLMYHQTGKTFEFNPHRIDEVCVFKLEVESLSGKRHE